MYKIDDTDNNFKIISDPETGTLSIYDPLTDPFKIYGIFYEDGIFKRLDSDISQNTSDGVFKLHTCTAGGRIRFTTDSDIIYIHAVLSDIGRMSHFALTGSSGFDLYEFDGNYSEYLGSFIPEYDISDNFKSFIKFPEKRNRQLLINFPTYTSVKSIEIGINSECCLQRASEYINDAPVIFYGSSITQGGCSSRPGCTYPALLSSKFNFDYINLGFSGNAKGELILADHITKLKPSLFFYDYDYNAPDINHLNETHYKFYRHIKDILPDLPVIIMSRPKYKLNNEDIERLKIINNTYNKAVNNGDRNVFILPGPDLMQYCKTEGTVDTIHPTDFGFYSMAKTIEKLISSYSIIDLIKKEPG